MNIDEANRAIDALVDAVGMAEYFGRGLIANHKIMKYQAALVTLSEVVLEMATAGDGRGKK